MIGKKPHQALRIEPLNSQHDREGFSCGVSELDTYIRQQAGQDFRRNLAAVFVLTPDSQQIAGYYALSAHTLNARDLPGNVGRKLPRFPLPVTLLGRLAVSETSRGQGFGKLLLMDALKRALLSSKQVASWAVVVDAKAGVRDFYLGYEFLQLPFSPDRLYLTMKSIEELISS